MINELIVSDYYPYGSAIPGRHQNDYDYPPAPYHMNNKMQVDISQRADTVL